MQFAICAELDDAVCELPAGDRVVGAVERWAPGSALVTQLLFIAAIVVSELTATPTMAWFCSHLAAGVVAGWLIQVCTRDVKDGQKRNIVLPNYRFDDCLVESGLFLT